MQNVSDSPTILLLYEIFWLSICSHFDTPSPILLLKYRRISNQVCYLTRLVPNNTLNISANNTQQIKRNFGAGLIIQRGDGIPSPP